MKILKSGLMIERKAAGAGQFRVRQLPFEVKDIGEAGTFSGYASVWSTLDSYREVVAKGAFKKSLKRIKATGRPLPALWQHDTRNPIGGYTLLEEDEKGLYVEGALLIDEIMQAKEAHALIRAKIVSGLSIGFYTIDDSYNDKERVRTLKEVDLQECSLVTFPANDDARIDAVKSKLAHGTLPSLPEFEGILREVGFSKTQAAVVANRGLPHLLRGEPEADRTASDLATVLSGFSLKF